ncbi:MAG TPA: T9SS type A sorting domain-containing protein [Chryseosolibacter sp.]
MLKRPEGPLSEKRNVSVMRFRSTKVIVVAFCLLVSSIGAFAQQDWLPKNNGFYGGHITALWSEGDLVLAGTERAGIFRSTDGGVTWAIANNGLTNKTINNFLSSGDSIFAATHFAGIFLSLDDGKTWSGIGNGLANIQVVTLEKSGKHMYAGTVDGVFRSSDVGKTWQSMSQGLPAGNLPFHYPWMTFIKAYKHKLFAGTSYKGLVTSSDNGATWTSVTSIPADTYVSAFVEKDGLLFVGTYNLGVYVSADEGATWNALENTLPNVGITGFAVVGDRMYASTYSGLFVSENNGSVWSNVPMSAPSPSATCILKTTDGLLIGTREQGIRRSTDGTDWTQSSNGLTALIAENFVEHKGRLYAGTYNGIYRATASGAEWEPAALAFDVTPLYEMASVGDSLFASNYNQIHLSTDGGNSWTYFPSYGLAAGAQLKVRHNKAIYATTQEGLYRLYQGKTVWQVAIPASNGFDYHHIVRGSGDTLVSATWNGRIYISVNDGINWELHGTGLPESSAVYGLTIYKNNIFVSMNEGVFRSSDAGKTWVSSTHPTPGSSVMSLYGHGDFLFAGTFNGLYYSRDMGKSWLSGNDTRMAGVVVQSLTIKDDHLYAGTTEGVYAMPLSALKLQFLSFSPSEGKPGDLIAIAGKHLSPDFQSNQVDVNGVKAEISLASGSLIVFKIPAGATSGPITLTSGGFTLTSPEPICVKIPDLAISGSPDINGFLLVSSKTQGNQWFLDDQQIPGATQNTLLVSDPGTYEVRITDAVCFTQAFYSVLVTAAGTDPEMGSLLYPVPATTSITVNLQQFSKENPVDVEIFNSAGLKVGVLQSNDRDEAIIPTGELERGLYIVRMRQGNHVVSQRFTKED